MPNAPKWSDTLKHLADLKFYYKMQNHLLQDFEKACNHFGILGIKGLRTFIKIFPWNLLLYFTISTFKLTLLF